MLKLSSILFFIGFLLANNSICQNYLNEDYSNPYFQIIDRTDSTITIHMDMESDEIHACDSPDFICTLNSDGNYYCFISEEGDMENVIIMYGKDLVEGTDDPKKLVYKSNGYMGHPCDVPVATYLWDAMGD